jgi:phage terminase large subunit-like protein
MPAAVTANWIRDASDTVAVARGCTFDEAAGQFACDFVEAFCRQSKGRWRGQAIELLPWQRDLIMRAFGWKAADGTRRFRRVYVEVPKKNGKSTLVSALVLLLLLADGEPAPEVYLNAVDREQAAIVFDEAARMVAASPELAARLDVIPSKGVILDPANDGKLKKNSADAPSKDGVNASAWIFDELHRLKSREMYDIFRYAGASRDQPLEIVITTAGEDTTGVWHELREYSDQVAAGTVEDTTHLGVVFRADREKDDLDDPAVWRRVNPSMGVTIQEEDFAREYAEAKAIPSNLGNFLRLRLGVVSSGDSKFCAPEAWAACAGVPDLAESRECYLGLDMSSKVDLTALVAAFPDPEGRGFDLAAWFWTPADGLALREKRDGAAYRVWAAAGVLTVCDGGEIDYAAVKARILECSRTWRVKCLGGDPWNVAQLLQELQEAEGMHVMAVRQGFASLSTPTKTLEGLIAGRRLRHGGNPLLAWCLLNAVAQKDENSNIRLSKKKSGRRIDGASALVNAIAVAATGQGEDRSVYEERGILIV